MVWLILVYTISINRLVTNINVKTKHIGFAIQNSLIPFLIIKTSIIEVKDCLFQIQASVYSDGALMMLCHIAGTLLPGDLHTRR